MGVMTRNVRTAGMLAGLLLLPACAGSGTRATHTVDVAFKGRCVDAKGEGIPVFSLSVGRASEAQPSAKTVHTKNGQFQTRLSVSRSAATTSQALGSRDEKITIRAAAAGYKSKHFTVAADQVFVGTANTLNVTLELVPAR